MTQAPNATDWITAVSTAGALIAAGVAAFITWRVYRHERKAREADQAGRVGAWAEWRSDLPNPFPGHMSSSGHGYVLLNTSPLPVYDVLLIFWLLGGSPELRAGTSQELVLPPGQKVASLPSNVAAARERHEETHPSMLVEIRFTDSSGQRWWRGRNGVLTNKGPWKPTPAEPETERDQQVG